MHVMSTNVTDRQTDGQTDRRYGNARVYVAYVLRAVIKRRN